MSRLMNSVVAWVRRNWLVLTLVLAAGLIYLPSLDHLFIYDDTINIVRNPSIRQLSNTFEFFHKAETATSNMSFAAVYRPLSTLSYAIDYALFRLEPSGYILHNLLLHLLAVAVCVSLFRVLTRSAWLAAAAGLAFALHPVQTEPVNWPTGRATILFALFYLLAVRLYVAAAGFGRRASLDGAVSGETASAISARSGVLWSLSWIAAAAALWSKEMAVTLPAVLVLVEWLLPPQAGGRWSRRAWRLLPYAVLAAAYVGVRTIVLGGLISRHEYWGGSVLKTLQASGRVVLRYAQLLLLPVNQNLEHVVPIPETALDPLGLLGVLFAASAILLVLVLRKRYPVSAFGLLWIGVILSPVLNIVPFYGLIAERHLYLVLPGFGLILGDVIARLTERVAVGGEPTGVALSLTLSEPRQKVAVVVLALIGIGYATAAMARSRLWGDEVLLWEDTVAKSPTKLKAHNNLGLAYLRQDRLDEAVDQFHKALEIYPRSAGAHTSLGLLHLTRNQPELAVESLLRALEERPRTLDAHRHLGMAYLRLSRWRKAEEIARRALDIREELGMRYVLGAALMKQDRLPEAEEAFSLILVRDPDYGDALRQMGVIRYFQGRVQESEEYYRRALAVGPTPDLYFNLAVLELKEGDYAAAAADFARSRELAPNVAEVALRQSHAEIFRDLRGKVRPDLLRSLRPELLREHAAFTRSMRGLPGLDEISSRLEPATDLHAAPQVRLAVLATLALLARSQGNLTGARVYYETMLAEGGEAAHLHGAIGEMAAQSGEYELAEHHMRQALELDSTLLQAHGRLAFLARMRGDTAGALAHYQRALSVVPDHPAALDGRCISYYDLERWQESLQCFEGRVAAVPEHPQAYYYLGRLYRRAGQVEAAQRMFDRHREIRRSREGSGLGVATIED